MRIATGMSIHGSPSDIPCASGVGPAARIRGEGLPVPVKSSCFFCAAMKPDEVRTLPQAYLRLIVLIEARAKPRLREVAGLWRAPVLGHRRGATARPGSMTEYIREKRLIEEAEIERIIADAPVDLVAFQQAAACVALEDRAPMRDWLERFHQGADYRAG